MPNTVHNRLFLHLSESSFNLFVVVERCFIHERVQLRFLVGRFHLAEHHLDWHKLEAIRHIPDGFHLHLFHRLRNSHSFVHLEVVHEDVQSSATILILQRPQKFDESVGLHSLVDGHDCIHTSVCRDGRNYSDVTIVEIFLIDALVLASRSVLQLRHRRFRENDLVKVDHSFVVGMRALQLKPTLFLPFQVFLSFVFVRTFETSDNFASNSMLAIQLA